MMRVSGTEENHLYARFVANESIGCIDQTARTSRVDKEI
jgi:hypothetical protein